jgi:DNA-binding response OmpR family regulator
MAAILALVDELMMQSRVELAARAAGWRVQFAARPEELWSLARAERPALLLVGATATRQPWEELVRTWKADAELSRVPVVAFGSHLDQGLRRRARAAGCDRMVANSVIATDFGGLLAQLGVAAPG